MTELANTCENLGLWPVLVGEPGVGEAILAAPMILEDYPRVAPESSGDLFDATEIDEILTLRILTLTDAEKEAMSRVDALTRSILERSDAHDERTLLKLHAVMKPVDLVPGDRVILRPRGQSDAFDLLLADLPATIATIEEDFEGQKYATVLVYDDPGKDLGMRASPGHRFFFRVDEVVKISSANGGTP
jgi:hypothetical protein